VKDSQRLLKSRSDYRNSTCSDDNGSGSLEGSLEGLARSSLNGSNLGEPKGRLGIDTGVLSLSSVNGNDAGLDDLDRLMRGSVSAAHFSVYTKIED
jgi:hypothetical protein